MKIDKLKLGATIPVQQYGNIMPEIEISSGGIGEDVLGAGMDIIKGLFAKYSEKGEITEKDIVYVTCLAKKSFNEEGVVIDFEPIAHTYKYKDKPLQGATDFIKKFYKPFDVETIASVLESKWGVPAKVIKDLWESNGGLTSDFGNVVHKALEDYEKFSQYGEVISSAKGDEKNYCLPKHPILRAIIEGFITVNQTQKGKVVTEALISDVENGICGHADRVLILDEVKKICRIQDYKVNIDSEEIDKKYKVLEPFQDLPSNKLSKYQLQMSVYANMLQKSGWVVEGLDVFVYENEWKHYELGVLKVI